MSQSVDGIEVSDIGTQIKQGVSSSFVCPVCGRKFARFRSLVCHKRKHNQLKVFACHLCPKKFSRSDHLKGHVRRHLNTGDHPCNQCDQIFKRADRLKYHKVNEHGSTISLKELRTYSRAIVSDCDKKIQCKECDKTFHDEKNLKMHSRVHSPFSKYDCRCCGKSFSQRSNLNVHIRKHTGAKPYKCEVCDESFSTSCKLKTHARKHTGELPFVCDACGKQFGESHLLKMHMRIHENSKAYVCSHCGQSFTHSSTLRSHIRTHTGAKPYTCDICHESFSQISSLSYHKKTHSGEKPFVCDICGNKYTRKATLKSHQSRHTGNKIFSCSQCDFKCDISNQLRKHMLDSHVLRDGPISTQPFSKKLRHDHIDHAVQTQAALNDNQKNASDSRQETLNSCLSYKALHDTQHCISERNKGNPQDQIPQLVSQSLSANVTQEPLLSHNVSGLLTSGCIYKKSELHDVSVNVQIVPTLYNSLVTQSSVFNPTCSYVIPGFKEDQGEGTDPSSLDPASVLPSESSHVNCQASAPSIPDSSQTFSVYQNKPHNSDYIPLQQMVQLDLECASQLHHSSSPKDKICMSLIQISQPVSENASITPSQSISCSHAPSISTHSPSTLSQTKFSATESLNQHHSNEEEGKDNVTILWPHQIDLNQVHNCQGDAQVIETSSSEHDKQELDGTSHDMRETSNEKETATVLDLTSFKDVDEIDTVSDRQLVLDNGNLKSVFTHFTNFSLDIRNTDYDFNESSKEDPKESQKLESSICMHNNISKLPISHSNNDNKEDHFQRSDTKSTGKQTILEYNAEHSILQPQSICTKLPKLCLKTGDTMKNIMVTQSVSDKDTRPVLRSKSRNLDHKVDKKSSEKQTQVEKLYKLNGKDCGGVPLTVSHIMKFYSCQMCEQKFIRKRDLVTHMCVHHGEKPFKCSACSKGFSRSDHLNAHLLLHSRSKELRCYYCSNEFTDPKDLDEHIHNIHNGLYPFRCNICNFSCLDVLQLKGHVGQFHSDFKFSCQICGLTAITSKNFHDHMKEHPGESAIKCHLCGQSFSQVSVLKLHIRRKHDEEKHFACGVCQRAFFTAADLQRHLRNHLGDRPFACEICKKAFADSKLLRLHCKTHFNEKPFQCSHCHRNFAHRSTLTSHIRIHTGSKPFVCDVCGDAFTQSSSLGHHQQVHNRQKTYTCHVCGKTYTRMATLNIHLLQHDGRSRFSCPHCAYKCNKMKTLKRHMEKCKNIKAVQVSS